MANSARAKTDGYHRKPASEDFSVTGTSIGRDQAECRPAEDEIIEEIKTTIVHEVAHFFGLDDEYLEDLGYG